jgi:hypothetical protein
MAKREQPTRAQRRAERTPDAGVYRIELEDPAADSWFTHLIVFCESPAAATELLKAVGLSGKVTRRYRAEADLPAEALELATASPGTFFLSQANDVGWSAWSPLPPDYELPHKARLPRITKYG